jgi:membrane-associated protein
MIEAYYLYVCENAHQAHWIIFILFLLAGCNLPISEDLLMIGGGAIAATCIPDHTFRLYIWILMGCYLSSWETYWIGRLLGPKLYRIRLFSYVITPERLERLRFFYAKLGIFTFIVGRFCPGGIRNVLFLSSGLTRMPFHLYVIRDGFAALISTTIFFSLGYLFGSHFNIIIEHVQRYSFLFFMILVGLLLSWLSYVCLKHRKDGRSHG